MNIKCNIEYVALEKFELCVFFLNIFMCILIKNKN